MTATYTAMTNQSSYCNSSAAAGTSVRICKILDTVILAVSIIRLFSLLVIKV